MDLHIQGLDAKEIARMMGKSEVGVGMVIRSPVFEEECARRRAATEKANDEAVAVVAVRAKEKIEGAAEDAADKLVELMDDENSAIQFKSCTDILDRVFGRAGDKEDKRPTILIEGDALFNLQLAIREAG